MAIGTAVGSNAALVREYTQRVFNEHNPKLASEYVTPDVKWHGGTLGTVRGRQNLAQLLRGFSGALPDLSAQEQDVVAGGDTVAMLRRGLASVCGHPDHQVARLKRRHGLGISGIRALGRGRHDALETTA